MVVSPSCKITSERFSQSRNAPTEIELMLPGIEMLSRARQSSKAYEPISKTPSGMTIDDRDIQFLNANSSILLSVGGSAIDSKAWQP